MLSIYPQISVTFLTATRMVVVVEGVSVTLAIIVCFKVVSKGYFSLFLPYATT